MTISNRLLLLVGVAILALVLMAGFGLQKINQVYEEADYGNENTVPSLLLLDKTLLEFSHIRVRLYRHVLSNDDQAKSALESKLNEARENLDNALHDYERMLSDGEDKRLLGEDHASFQRYFDHVKIILDLSRAKRGDEALQQLTEGAKTAEHFNETLAAHMKFKENLGAKMAAEALSNKQAATWWSIITALATLIAVGWIGLHIRARLVSSLAEANRLAERVAAGDLSSRGIAASDSDEIGDLMRSMEKMRSDLSVTVGQILSGTEGMVTSSDQLSAAALQVSTSSHQQSSATASAAAAVEQLTVSIDHVGNNAADAHNRAQQAGHTAVESGQGVEMASNRIGEVARSVEHNAQQVQVLSEQVREIGNITTVIRDVADQTNLLALNAAIEAARAGEQGRGFAVVADEVRKLAERTTRSIQEISSVIGSIQNGVAEAVDSMQASRSIVADVVTAAQSASASMQDVRTDTENVGKSISEISSALSEQRMASTDLARNVESIAQMSEENSAAASQVADTANRLVALSGNLKSSVSRFRL